MNISKNGTLNYELGPFLIQKKGEIYIIAKRDNYDDEVFKDAFSELTAVDLQELHELLTHVLA